MILVAIAVVVVLALGVVAAGGLGAILRDDDAPRERLFGDTTTAVAIAVGAGVVVLVLVLLVLVVGLRGAD